MWRQRFGNSADRDEAQYRRGAALGLTFGELFLLLAFILLLLLGLLESERRSERAEAASFEPVRKAAERAGASPEALSALLEAVGDGNLDGVSRAYVAAADAGIEADKLADVLSAVTDRTPEDFDMVRRDLATGAKLRETVPEFVPDVLAEVEPDSLRRVLEIADTIPPDLDSEKLAMALDIAADADEPTVAAIRRAIARDDALGGDIAEAVSEALGPLIERTGGSVDPSTGSVTLPEAVLFAQGSDELSAATRAFLTSFCGPWIRTVHGFGARIAELRIEGHSSSEWGGLPPGDPDAYLKNLDLSQRRSAAVLQFCLSREVPPGIADWARQRLVAVGLSSSRPVLDPRGQEDAGRSRRVIFGFETNKRRVLDEILTRIEADEVADTVTGSAVPAPVPDRIRDQYQGPARVVEAGLLEVDGATLRLAGITAPAADAVCPGPDGQRRPCGRIAAFRLAQWLGDSTVTCVPRNGERDASGHPLVHCAKGDTDVETWLIDAGHAAPRL